MNPYTGVFLYPFTHGDQGSTGDAKYKRIQVANDDLDPALNPGAQYFGSAQYVAKDDAQAGNGENNAAWIGINVGTFSGGNWNLSLSGGTNRQDPAIRAWEDADPTVMLTDIHAPGEGLFIVGSNAYDNGNGTWDYEYAVFNLNSDISCGSFEVPTQAGTTITNVGFHDSDSHSGEPYSNVDWPGIVGGSDVSWASETFGANSNANAIRWGTLYNFRFTANAAPVTGSVDVGMFKTGGTVAAAAKVPGTGVGSPLSILCDPNNNHFQGDYVKLNTSSFGSGTGSDLHLEATDGPTSQFGFFLIGGGGGGSVVQSNGILCLTSPLARYNSNVATNQGLPQFDSIGQFDGAGTFQSLSGNSLVGSGFDVPLELPHLPAGQMILAGQTHYFQLWYRDMPAGSANWSNVLGASF